MFNYECELCNKSFSATEEQKNPVCPSCRELYNINNDYIYGTGEYAKKKTPIEQTPLPRRRKVVPLWVPSGTVYSTLPSMEGTCTVSPSTA